MVDWVIVMPDVFDAALCQYLADSKSWREKSGSPWRNISAHMLSIMHTARFQPSTGCSVRLPRGAPSGRPSAGSSRNVPLLEAGDRNSGVFSAAVAAVEKPSSSARCDGSAA